MTRPGRVAQLVTCLATDACLTADPGVTSLFPAWSHTLVEKQKYVHKLPVNCLFKLAKVKVWLGELTILPWP